MIAADFVVGEVEGMMMDVIAGRILGHRFSVGAEDGVKVGLRTIFSEAVLGNFPIAEPDAKNAGTQKSNAFPLAGDSFLTC